MSSPPPEVVSLLSWAAQAAAASATDPLGTQLAQLDAYAEVWRIYRERGEDIPPEIEKELLYGTTSQEI